MALDAGYDTVKTNIQIPGDPFRTISQGTTGPHDQVLSRDLQNAAVRQISAMREEAGPGRSHLPGCECELQGGSTDTAGAGA